MKLIGLDVGFSATRPSSGVARLGSDGQLRLANTTSAWASRRAVIGSDMADVAAVDAPYTTAESSETRSCERVFIMGAFQQRCKPGMSHVPGTGQKLRTAGWDTAQQLMAIVPSKAVGDEFPRVTDCNVVEAFPNAYLGVCIEVAVYDEMPAIRRGKKFDWLYDTWVRAGLFRQVSHVLGLDPHPAVLTSCQGNQQHDQRAALVCLLTAAGVLAGEYVAVGDEAGGYFFLPPWPCWAFWARDELDRQRARVAGLDVWISGQRFQNGDSLPAAT